jgi:hypothetical protein
MARHQLPAFIYVLTGGFLPCCRRPPRVPEHSFTISLPVHFKVGGRASIVPCFCLE